MMNKKYLAITNNGTKLYELNLTKTRKFNKRFPNWDNFPKEDEHNEALKWVEENGKLLGNCDACCYC